MSDAHRTFLDIREAAKWNSDILGLVVTGSRGKGFENAWSDYDLALFVEDVALAKYRDAFGALSGGQLYIFTLESFKRYAIWGSDRAWDRYSWAHLNVESDKTGGEIKRLMDEKSRVPECHAGAYMHESLGWFIKQVYRSMKCHRTGDHVGFRLEAAELVRSFLQAVFCLHDRRLMPYYTSTSAGNWRTSLSTRCT